MATVDQLDLKPMSDDRRKSLTALLPEFQRNLMLGNMEADLHTDAGGVLNDGEIDEVFCKGSRAKQVLELISTLRGKSNADFEAFCRVLINNGYACWARKLKEKAGLDYESLPDLLSTLPSETQEALQQKREAFQVGFKHLKSRFNPLMGKIRTTVLNLTPVDYIQCVTMFNDELRYLNKHLNESQMKSADNLLLALSQERWYSTFNLKVLDILVECIPKSTGCQEDLTKMLDDYRSEHLAPLMNTTMSDLVEVSSIASLRSEGLNLILICRHPPTLKVIEEAKEYLKEMGVNVEGLKFDWGCFIIYLTIIHPLDCPDDLAKTFSLGHHRHQLRQFGIHRVLLLGHWTVEMSNGTVSHCDEVGVKTTLSVSVQTEKEMSTTERLLYEVKNNVEKMIDQLPDTKSRAAYLEAKRKEEDEHLIERVRGEMQEQQMTMMKELVEQLKGPYRGDENQMDENKDSKRQLKKVFSSNFESFRKKYGHQPAELLMKMKITMLNEIGEESLKAFFYLQKDEVSIGGVIGEGYFSEVQEATWHCSPCAVKNFKVNPKDEKEMKLVEREAYTWAAFLRHPNIVQFYGLLEGSSPEGLPSVVMELLTTNLQKFLEDCRTHRDSIPLDFKRAILLDVCRAMEYLHSQSIIHGDLHGKNILLTASLVAKVSDFGAARLLDTVDKGQLTQSIGDRNYAAPEVENEDYDSKVDVYSFGSVTILTLTHKEPVPKGDITSNGYARRKYLLSDLSRGTKDEFQLLLEGCFDVPDERPSFRYIEKDLSSKPFLKDADRYKIMKAELNNLYTAETKPTSVVKSDRPLEDSKRSDSVPEESHSSSEEKSVLTKEDSPAPKRPGGRVTKLFNDPFRMRYTILAVFMAFIGCFILFVDVLLFGDKRH